MIDVKDTSANQSPLKLIAGSTQSMANIFRSVRPSFEFAGLTFTTYPMAVDRHMMMSCSFNFYAVMMLRLYRASVASGLIQPIHTVENAARLLCSSDRRQVKRAQAVMWRYRAIIKGDFQ